MSETQTQAPKNPEQTLTAEQIVEQRDKLFAIVDVPADETRESFPVKRSDNTIENNWFLTGEGINPQDGKAVGRFQMIDKESGQVATKYISMEAQHQLKAAERERQYDARRVAPKLLGEESVHAVITEPAPHKPESSDSYSYLREELPPVTRPENSGEKTGFDWLFADDAHYQAELSRQDRPKSPEDIKREYYDRFVTEENRTNSQAVLTEALRANPQLADILRDAGLDPRSLEAVDAIRENADVRYEVAKYLVDKLDRVIVRDPTSVGWRIEENSPRNMKVDSVTGQRMLSRTYAISLALKMIDGEFSDRRADDSHATNESGRVINAQHRAAATMALMSY